jgi:glutaredoxin-related protein
MRLTGRDTFPNVIDVRHGQSIGGSDTMQALHQAGKLRNVLENAGVHVG